MARILSKQHPYRNPHFFVFLLFMLGAMAVVEMVFILLMFVVGFLSLFFLLLHLVLPLLPPPPGLAWGASGGARPFWLLFAGFLVNVSYLFPAPVCLSVCLSVYLSGCLVVCLPLSFYPPPSPSPHPRTRRREVGARRGTLHQPQPQPLRPTMGAKLPSLLRPRRRRLLSNQRQPQPPYPCRHHRP